MPPSDPQQDRLFRRVMLGGCVVSLLLFAWTVWMIVHFNGTPASVRLGVGTVIKLASVILPGSVLLVFLAWQRRSRISRVLGWVVVLPAIAIPGVFVFYTTSILRPPFATAEYDAAAREAETAALALLNADAPAMRDGKDVRERVRQQPQSSDELVSLSQRTRSSAGQIRSAGRGLAGLRKTILAPFEMHGVDKDRADEFARIYIGPINTDGLEKSYAELADAYDGFARRLEYLAQHWGKWRWKGDGAVKFDDAELGRVYEAGVPVRP